MKIFDLEDEHTWPSEVTKYLEKHFELFGNWETRNYPVDAKDYDNGIYGLREILKGDFALLGYHCTRLTEDEIQEIKLNGMRLPSQEMLIKRIDIIEQAGLITKEVAEKLRLKNQAADRNRASMIWFCFFLPYVATQDGIERFFRSWGGEALYNSHESNALTGAAISKIGIPCIIEAYVPTVGLAEHGGLDFKLIARFLRNRGIDTDDDVDYEDRSMQPIPSNNIYRIIKFPDPEFIRLTRCDEWEPEISNE